MWDLVSISFGTTLSEAWK